MSDNFRVAFGLYLDMLFPSASPFRDGRGPGARGGGGAQSSRPLSASLPGCQGLKCEWIVMCVA